MKIIISENQLNNLSLNNNWLDNRVKTISKKIIVTESQYSKLLLKEETFNASNILDNILDNQLPGANAGEIQKFLKNRGYYKGEVDYDFKDGSAKSFSDYYYTQPQQYDTVKKLYNKLKKDGMDVGNKSGFGPKMAKVLSELIVKKEKELVEKIKKETKNAKDAEDFSLELKKMMKDKENYDLSFYNNTIKSDRLGPNGSFQPLKHTMPVMFANKHDSKCNDKWRKNCSSKGVIATNVTRKGKEWDALSGNATKNTKTGEYNTLMWGHDDNKNYTKCRCRKGKVISSPRTGVSWNDFKDKLEDVTVYDTKFIGSGAEINPIKYNAPFARLQRGEITDKQYNQLINQEMRRNSREFSALNDKTGLEKFFHDYRHEIIDVLAVAALFIPVPGLNVAISMGLEGLNAAMYVAEGDNTSGFLSVIFMAVPGIGPLARRITQKGVKRVYNVFEVARNMKSSGKSVDEIAEYMAEQSKKLSPNEQKFLKEINKPENIKKIEQSGKELQSLTQGGTHFKPKDVLDNAFGRNSKEYNQFLKYQTGFGKNSKFFKELANPTKLEKYIYAGAVGSGIIVPFIMNYFSSSKGDEELNKAMAAEYQEKLLNALEGLENLDVDKFIEKTLPVYVDTLNTAKDLKLNNKQIIDATKLESKTISEFEKDIKNQNKVLKDIKQDVSEIFGYDKSKGKNLTSTEEGQKEITDKGDIIKSSDNWDYTLHKGLYFTRKKGNSKWLLLTNPTAISRLDKKTAEEYHNNESGLETTSQIKQAWLQELENL